MRHAFLFLVRTVFLSNTLASFPLGTSSDSLEPSSQFNTIRSTSTTRNPIMNLRRKMLSLAVTVVAFNSIQTAQAGGCGGFGGLSIRVGGGGIAGRILGNHGGMHRPSANHHQPQHAHAVPYHVYPQHTGHRQSNYAYPPHIPQQHMQVQAPYPHDVHFVDGDFDGGDDWGVPMQSQGMQQPSPGMQAAPVRQASRPAPQRVVSQASNPQPYANMAQQPMNATQGRVDSMPANSSQTPPATLEGTADASEMSALQMLASLNGEDTTGAELIAQPSVTEVDANPELTTAAMQSSSTHVGSWTVNLPGNQTITLGLDNENRFQWLATKDGKSTSFNGQFRLEGNRLTLVRSNDLQQMAGDWTGEGDNFTFKLDGATNSGLAFVRGQ
jgi:hypothetical protein